MNRSCRICQPNVSMSDAEAFALILSIFATAEQDLVSSDDVAAVHSDEKM